jgi:rRNA processing protein Gar1
MTKKKLGETLHRSKSSGHLIIRLDAEARIGEPVMDSRGKRVGEVFDIFGPVETPYASVKLKDDSNIKQFFELFIDGNEDMKKKSRIKKAKSNRRTKH